VASTELRQDEGFLRSPELPSSFPRRCPLSRNKFFFARLRLFFGFEFLKWFFLIGEYESSCLFHFLFLLPRALEAIRITPRNSTSFTNLFLSSSMTPPAAFLLSRPYFRVTEARPPLGLLRFFSFVAMLCKPKTPSPGFPSWRFSGVFLGHRLRESSSLLDCPPQPVRMSLDHGFPSDGSRHSSEPAVGRSFPFGERSRPPLSWLHARSAWFHPRPSFFLLLSSFPALLDWVHFLLCP